MYRYFYIILFAFLLACSGDDDTVVIDPPSEFVDDDGDGVANSVELNSGTDPNDGCSFNLSEQDYGKTTVAWRNQDCDGDGVINGTEIDPDGNETNDGNGTNPLDSCSLDYTAQTLEPSSAWLELDCDEDCVSNQDEIDANTDPTDPDVFPGSGTKLQSVTWYETDGSIKRRTTYNEDGNRILEHAYSDDLYFWSSYEYDLNNRLSKFTSQIATVEFEYENGLISTITKSGTFGFTKTVSYDGNEIKTDDGNAPSGWFTDKIVLNPATGKAEVMESFTPHNSYPDYYLYQSLEFSYDASGINVILIQTTNLEYDATEGMFYPSPGGNVTESMEYEENALNPSQQAFEEMYIHGLFENEINGGALFQNKCAGCPKLINRYSASFDLGFIDNYLTVNCLQRNGLPFMADRSSFYEPDPEAMVYIYKN